MSRGEPPGPTTRPLRPDVRHPAAPGAGARSGPAGGTTAVHRVFDRVCSWGRWGGEDQRGTLNLITPEIRRSALRQVVSGDVYALGRLLDPARVPGSALTMTTPGEVADVTCRDQLTLAPHGFDVTHLDALGHCFFEGWVYNGRRAADVVTPDGLVFADVAALAPGVTTRGVLLDVAASRGVDHLDDTDQVLPADLDAAAERAGVEVGPGDAVLVRTGRAEAERRGRTRPGARAGLALDCLVWLHEHDVAVYGGDCVDVLPSPYPDFPDYFHQVALAGMGLVLLDVPDVEVLAGAVRREGRSDFCLQVSAPRLVGGTGAAVNPLACF